MLCCICNGYGLQVVCRHLVKSALLVNHLKTTRSSTGTGPRPSPGTNTTTFFPASADGAILHFPLHPPTKQQSGELELGREGEEKLLPRLLRATLATFERTGDRLSEACTALLTRCNGEYFENNLNVTRRSLNMLAEASVACGLLGLTRQSGVLVSTLCRFTIPPQWQQTQDWLGERDRSGGGEVASRGGEGTGVGASEREGSLSFATTHAPPPPPPPCLTRRHLQSFARLTQVLH